MAEERNSETGEERGVFGNLPSERPGTRSPRRRPARLGQEGPKGASKQRVSSSSASGRGRRHSAQTAPPPSSPPPRSRHETAPEGRPEPEEPETTRPGPRGVEELAWAGITVAAEAATLGVRLLNRAVEAVRKPADRR